MTLNVLCRRAIALLFLMFSLGFSSGLSAQYDGRDANAAWRAEAATKIDQHRKADMNIVVKLSDGTVLDDANINVSMQRHAFNFGSALDARYFLQTQSRYDSRYEEKVKELFTSASFENHMKWRAWAGDFGSTFLPSVTQEGLDWLNGNDISVRGHAMMWPRYQSVPDTVRALLDIENPTQQNLQDIYDSTINHIEDIGAAVQGKVYNWDMLNEPRTSFDIEDKLIGFTPAAGTRINSRTDLRKQWFATAQAMDSDASMFLNDFAILPGGDDVTTPRADHRAIIQDLVDNGVEIDGLGFQSHFKDADNRKATGIPKVWELLDGFQSDFGMPVHITEFDFDTTDKALQADYTRDFMTAAFAHDSVEAFILWGFWEGKMANPGAALFDLDFNANANGLEYLDLVFNQWWTEEAGQTDMLGAYSVRGFKGDYLITVEHDGVIYDFNASMGDFGLNFEAIVSVPEPTGFGALSMLGLLVAKRRRS